MTLYYLQYLLFLPQPQLVVVLSVVVNMFPFSEIKLTPELLHPQPLLSLHVTLFPVTLETTRPLLFIFLKTQSKNATANANMPSAIATITRATLSNIAATIKNAAKNVNPTKIGQ